MTNSAKQTKKAKSEANERDASVTSDSQAQALIKNPAVLLGSFILVVGWVFILHINRWHFTVPVVMLWLGWAGVLATARFLWWTGLAMAADPEDEVDSFDVSASRHRELLEEKKALLRAIKEIEFDRDLGKMSPEDAKEIMRFYRARAIDVIKEIDGQKDSELTVAERIERDLQARLAVETKTKKKTPAAKAKPEPESKSEPESESESESEPESESESESEDETPKNKASAVEEEDASVESA